MYAQFDHLRPVSVSELLETLERIQGSYQILGGGTDMIVDLRDGKLKSDHLVDVKRIEAFQAITDEGDCVRIGCAATLSQIAEDPLVRQWAPALAQAVGKVGSVQIRNKGTLAGNIQTASPAGDGLNAAYALDGVAVLLSAAGQRCVALQEYVCGPRRTLLKCGEVLAFIELPKRVYTKEAFFKVGKRNALAISVVNGVVAVDIKDGLVEDARISVGAVAPTPLRITAAEEMLHGKVLTSELAEEVGQLVSQSVHPISDIRASAEYRAYMAGTMVKRQLQSFMEEDAR